MGRNPISWIIKRWGSGDLYWSHAAVRISDDLVVESEIGKGVVITKYEDFVKRYRWYAEVEYDISKGEQGKNWLMDQVGKKYDYLAIFGFMFRTSWQEEDSWHCNELVEAYLLKSGIHRWRSTPNKITPNMGYSNLKGTKGGR